MPADFKCSTDAGVQLIFDPTAVAEMLQKKDTHWFDAIAEEVKAGRVAARMLDRKSVV